MPDPASEPQPGDGLLAGDYVELSGTGHCGTFVGFDDEGGRRFAMVIREDGAHGSGPNGTYTANPGDVTVVRRRSQPTPSAPPCDACGAESCPASTGSPVAFSYDPPAHLCHACWNSPTTITEPRVIARRKSLAAKNAPADTLPIGEFRYGITTEESWHGDGVLVQGWVRGLLNLGTPDVVVLEFRDAAGLTATVRRDSLSATPPDTRADYVKPPPARPKADPYAEHRFGLIEKLGRNDDESIAALTVTAAASKRKRFTADLLRELDRRASFTAPNAAIGRWPEPVRKVTPRTHPDSFPSNEGSENYEP